MKHNRKGFTLIELLIAATIIGILAVFATVSYRNSAADTRVAGARSKLDVLAGAVQRFNLDPSACPAINTYSKLTVANLINCGYLEKALWNETDEYFDFQICNESSSLCSSGPAYLACMTGISAKLPNHYLKDKGYRYCVDSAGKGVEQLGAE